MTEAVIVSTARTPIGKAYKGALNHTEGATLLGHAISSALSRAKIEGAEVEDVVMGCAMQQGTTGTNIARKALLRAGLPVSVAGTTIDRQCASGLQAIALAARSVIFDGVEVAIGGGGESISLVQNNQVNMFHAVDPELLAMKGDAYMAMLDTAEIVAKRYDISRERQDEYSLESQRRTAAAQQGGRFNDELAPIKTTMAVTDKATSAVSYREVTLADTPRALEAWLKPLVDAGVDILHCSQRRFWEPEFDGSDLNFAGWAKKVTGVPTISVGSVGLTGEFIAAYGGESSRPASLDELIRRLDREEFDLVAVGRALLQDPQWLLKVRDGRTEELMAFERAAFAELS